MKAAESNGGMVCTVAMLGHKADVAVMAMHADLREAVPRCRPVCSGPVRGGRQLRQPHGVERVATGLPEEIRARLYPTIPPEGKDMPAWCFYPMSKKREAHANWFTLASTTASA
ncbi:MAG: hypothetical protein R2713_19905 [Ilumatobacteraceae bacterium]